MKFASLKTSSRDGELLLVSKDLSFAVSVKAIAPTMQTLLENWEALAPKLEPLYAQLNQGKIKEAFAFDPAGVTSPLPRAHQFVDASAFLNHGNIMERAYNLTVKKTDGIAILVQRQGDEFLGPRDDYPFPTQDDQCDFEGEFAVITGDIKAGCTPQEAEKQIRLVTILNDVSMRKHLFRELSMGFGFINAKPAPVFGPVAVTLDELGAAWENGRIALDMQVSRNGEWFGNPNGREMDWRFGELLAHLAYNRNLKAGTILGSGTVSNRGYETVGSACLAERRAIETIAHGKASTDFINFGETLQFDVKNADGASIFGAIEHRFVQSK